MQCLWLETLKYQLNLNKLLHEEFLFLIFRRNCILSILKNIQKDEQ